MEEYLYDKNIAEPVITEGSAIRLLMDIIYKDKNLESIGAGDSDSFIF